MDNDERGLLIAESYRDRIENGESTTDICRRFGISPPTLYYWARKHGTYSAAPRKRRSTKNPVFLIYPFNDRLTLMCTRCLCEISTDIVRTLRPRYCPNCGAKLHDSMDWKVTGE